MKKCLIVGAGKMGTCIAWAMSKLNFDVCVYDPNPDSLKECLDKMISLQVNVKVCFELDLSHEYSVIISAAPYVANLKIAKAAKEANVPYCDLGGNPEVANQIQDLSGISPVFTDLGLAPGFANIIAEDILRTLPDTSSLKIMVGGLPAEPDNSKIKYNLVFSIEGLINEYSGNCDIIKDGEIVSVPALTETENISRFGEELFGTGTKIYGDLECFHTKGGLGRSLNSLKKRGLKDCCYKTLRFPGHSEIMREAMKALSDVDLRIFIETNCPPTTNDIVLVLIEAEANGIIHSYCGWWQGNSTWTAMQMLTAYPAAVVAAIIAKRNINKVVLDYSDILYTEFSILFKDLLSIIPPKNSGVIRTY